MNLRGYHGRDKKYILHLQHHESEYVLFITDYNCVSLTRIYSSDGIRQQYDRHIRTRLNKSFGRG